MPGNANEVLLSVCIVQPDVSGVSETFFRAQAERLPALVTVLHGRLYQPKKRRG